MKLESLKEYFFYTYELEDNFCWSTYPTLRYEFISLIRYKKKNGRKRIHTLRNVWNLMICGADRSIPPKVAIFKKKPSSIGNLWVDWEDCEPLNFDQALKLLKKYNYQPREWLFSAHPVKRELAKRLYESEI